MGSDCGASVSIEVPLSELFHKELAKKTSEDLRDLIVSKPYDLKEDNNA